MCIPKIQVFLSDNNNKNFHKKKKKKKKKKQQKFDILFPPTILKYFEEMAELVKNKEIQILNLQTFFSETFLKILFASQ